jgi:Cu2+-exporting ATPase
VKAFEEQGDTVIYIGWDGLVRAFTVISDMVRDEALPVVTELKNMKHVVMMVSGDNPRTTMAVASGVGIEKAESGVSPVGKKEVVTRLQEKGSRAMMIGDGINDAPALTAATVGVAMGRGTDIAMESSDAVLVRNDLRLVPSFIRLSRRAYGIIKQNIFWAFFYNIFAIPLAVAGVLHPIVAAFAMTASSLFVVGNSLRIRKGGG